MSSLKDPQALARRIQEYANRRTFIYNWHEFTPLIPHRTVTNEWIWLKKAYRRRKEPRNVSVGSYWEYTTHEDGLFRILKGEHTAWTIDTQYTGTMRNYMLEE